MKSGARPKGDTQKEAKQKKEEVYHNFEKAHVS
jgi:hypothetical protein